MNTLQVSLDGSKPTPSPIYDGNSEVKPPKARIVLKWVTFLPLDFWCTLPHLPNRINQIFSIYHVTLGAFPWREIGASQLVHTHSRCSPSKEGKSHTATYMFHRIAAPLKSITKLKVTLQRYVDKNWLYLPI